MQRKVLEDFRRFLRSRALVSENSLYYYSYWLSRFLSFSYKNKNEPVNTQVDSFIQSLCVPMRLASWQVRQARHAIELYFSRFLKGKEGVTAVVNKKSRYHDWNSLEDKLRQALRVKHYAYRTERSYIDWVRRFYRFMRYEKNKDIAVQEVASEDVREYLTYLAVKKNVASSTQNQAFNALLFLAREVSGVELADLGKSVRAKRGPKLPVVFSPAEVKDLFAQIEGKNALIIKLLYGSGLRLMELARLRVQDIDFNAGWIFVRASKQDKDRVTVLPHNVKQDLQRHLEKARKLHAADLKHGHGEVYLPQALARKYPNAGKEWKWQYVFPAANLSFDPRGGKIRRHHISPSAIQKLVRAAVVKAGILKPASVHTLRHTFATHLLLNGVNIREVQELLGHKSIETTMVYTHVLRDISNVPRSPLDSLYEGGGVSSSPSNA